jgi:hypothetical protein
MSDRKTTYTKNGKDRRNRPEASTTFFGDIIRIKIKYFCVNGRGDLGLRDGKKQKLPSKSMLILYGENTKKNIAA